MDFKVIISQRHIVTFVLVAAFIILGILLPFVPEKIRYALLLIGPALVIFFIILRNPYYGIFAFFLYSFLRPYDFIPALRALRLTMLIEVVTLVAWVLKLTIVKKEFKWNLLAWMYLGFIGVIGFTVITAENKFFAYNTFTNMLINFIVFVMAINIVDSPGRLNKLAWLLLLIHVYFALMGIKTFLSGGGIAGGQQTTGEVSGGFIGDENDFALVINMMLPFAFFGLFYFKNKTRLICFLMMLIFVFTIIGSFSRGGLVGLACLAFYFILSSKRKLLSLGVLLALAISMFLFAPSSYWEEAKSIKEVDEGTADTRIRYWKAGLRMFRDHPIIGVGAGNSGVHLPFYIRGGNRDPGTEWGRALHGTFPQVLADLGGLGSFFYFAMMFIAFKTLHKIKKRYAGAPGDNFYLYMANAVMGSLIAYFTCSIFLSTVYYPYLWVIYIFVVVLQQLHYASRQQPSTA